jgi:trans-2,3-dihydro-3-hydroxyanthranilate isomerase
MRSLRYVLCDVFTDRPLTGNQLAVFTDARGLDDALMQSLAREMNFSESVFVLPKEKGGLARIRIFTPTRELPFAGHPVLGTAFVLGTTVQLDLILLETGAGIIPVALERQMATVTFGWMSQPLPTWEPWGDDAGLLSALGLARAELPITVYDNGTRHVLVAVAEREIVAALTPDLSRLARLPGTCFSVFAGAGDAYKTRMFAPSAGVAEDAATGSAAGPIALHLARHELLAFGTELHLEQGAEIARPSVLHARVLGTAERIERLEVGGSAVIVGRCEIQLR